jgi:hypothetical protein
MIVNHNDYYVVRLEETRSKYGIFLVKRFIERQLARIGGEV